MFYSLLGIDKSEPKIVELKEPIKMNGVSLKTNMNSIYKDAGVLSKEYQQIKNKNIVKNKKIPWAFVAVSKNHDEKNGTWEYLMGDVVTDFNEVYTGLISFEIPCGTYAVFKIKPRFSFLWGITIGMTKKFIFTQWLPNSKYKISDNVVCDFEYHDERSLSKNPSIELYISIKEK